MTTRVRVAVLISGSGTNLQAIFDAQDAGTLAAEVALVISDRADAYGLQRTLRRDVPAAFLPLPRAPKAERAAVRAVWEDRMLALLNAYQPDIIVSAGFLRVLSGRFLETCGCPVINQHPALLPDGGGDTVTLADGRQIPALRGLGVVAQALALGLPVTGCTVHRVTPLVDDGPVLAHAEVPVLPGDTESTLHERIKMEERRLIVEVLQTFRQL